MNDLRYASALALLLAGCAAAAPSPEGPPAPGPRPDAAAEPPAAAPLLERGLDAAGLPPSKAGLVARGWAQESVHENAGGAERDDLRGVDDEPGEVQLRQAVLVLETAPANGEGNSPGGRVKLLYGTDARASRAAGLEVGGSGKGERFDLYEMVLALEKGGSLPLKVEGGRFLSPHGYESFEAPANDFPSRGFLFTYATPTTHTGARLTATPKEGTSIYYAAVRGWDNWEDPNGRLTHMLGGALAADGAAPGFAGNVSTGPEDAEGRNRRTLADATVTWKPGGGDTGLALNVLRGSEEETGRWWGGGLYATRPLGSRLSAALRGEYLDDDGGSRTGYDARLVEVSAALTLRPIPSYEAFRLRLEGRWDHSLDGHVFDGGRESSQTTVALDAILEF